MFLGQTDRADEEVGIKWTPTFIVHDFEGNEHPRFVGYVPSDDLIAQLGLAIGKIYFDTDRLTEAIDQFRIVIERHPNAGATPEAIFLLGVAEYKHTHDPKALRRAYDALMAKYPQSGVGSPGRAIFGHILINGTPGNEVSGIIE